MDQYCSKQLVDNKYNGEAMRKITILLMLLVTLCFSVDITVTISDDKVPRIKEAFLQEFKDAGNDNPTNQEVATAIRKVWLLALKQKVIGYEKRKAEREAIEALTDLELE